MNRDAIDDFKEIIEKFACQLIHNHYIEEALELRCDSNKQDDVSEEVNFL